MNPIYTAVHRADDLNHKWLGRWHNHGLCNLAHYLDWRAAGYSLPLGVAWNRHTCEV